MNTFELNNFTADLVEKTIHYIRYNIAKDGEPFVMCSITKDGKIEVKPNGEVITISNYKDICTYNKLIQNLYCSSTNIFLYENILKKGDKVIVISNMLLDIKNGILHKLNLADDVGIVDHSGLLSKQNIGEDYGSYSLKEIIPINQTDRIEKLKNDRAKIVQNGVSDIDTKIEIAKAIISRINNILPLLKMEVDNIKSNMLIVPTEGRKKSLKIKTKGVKRKEIKLERISKKLNSLISYKNRIIEDFEFNNCISVALKEIS
jgi:hypothetical protein